MDPGKEGVKVAMKFFDSMPRLGKGNYDSSFPKGGIQFRLPPVPAEERYYLYTLCEEL
jgi:hypothetical protein